jgi:hypothetical protein
MSLVFAAAVAAQSVPFPTYQLGPQTNGTFIVSDGTITTPSGTQINLGIRVRAKAIALNPNTSTHTSAALVMGTSGSNGQVGTKRHRPMVGQTRRMPLSTYLPQSRALVTDPTPGT